MVNFMHQITVSNHPGNNKRRLISAMLLLVILLLVAACTTPTPTPALPAANNNNVDWDHSPDALIVRLAYAGTFASTIDDLNNIPYCALWGDGHVIWVDPFADPQLVLEDRIDEARMRGFLEFMIDMGFFDWANQRDLSANPAESSELEQLTVTLYGQTVNHAGSHWPADTFEQLLNYCRHLSNAPVQYLPPGAWVSAVPVDVQRGAPTIPWSVYESRYPDVDLVAMPPDDPQWATGDWLQRAWEMARQGRTQLTQDGVTYKIAVQVPDLQESAPPAP